LTTFFRAFKLTSLDTFLTHAEACSILMHAARGFDAIRLPEPAVRYRDRLTGRWRLLWTGLQMANFAVPPHITYKNPRNYQLNPQTLNYPRAADPNNRPRAGAIVENLPFVCIKNENI
jgi:hypothetical protein